MYLQQFGLFQISRCRRASCVCRMQRCSPRRGIESRPEACSRAQGEARLRSRSSLWFSQGSSTAQSRAGGATTEEGYWHRSLGKFNSLVMDFRNDAKLPEVACFRVLATKLRNAAAEFWLLFLRGLILISFASFLFGCCRTC